MRYDISKRKALEMPNLGKGTECIKLLLSQTFKQRALDPYCQITEPYCAILVHY